MERISDGSTVLVQRDKVYRTFIIKKGRKLHLEKLSFYPDNAVGYCYGSCFKVEKHQLVHVPSIGRRWNFGEASEAESGTDNRGIVDDGASQELTEESIAEMKHKGASGQEIVDSMIEHSSTFKVRTKFSQEKYVRKKERKYIPVIRILRTTTKLLCEMYHERAPAKTCFLRSDSLAQILSLSNVHAHSNLLVMETTQGLLTGAMLERMGGHGKLIQVFYGDFPVRNILESFGHLSENDKSILMKYPFHRVGSLLSQEEAESSAIVKEVLTGKAEKDGRGQMTLVPAESEDGDISASQEVAKCELTSNDASEQPRGESAAQTIDDPLPDNNISNSAESADMVPPSKKAKLETAACDGSASPPPRDSAAASTATEHAQSDVAMDTDEPIEGQEQPSNERIERKKAKEEAYKEAESVLRQREMDGLVVVSRFHPEPVLMSLLHFVAPSRPVVVYCNILEPLVQCYKSLKESGHVFSIQISETWTRHYQVLPERTHPEMSMDGRSGYILFTTKIKK